MKYLIILLIFLSGCAAKKGDNGLNGGTGPQGSQGAIGNTGNQGPQGVPGIPGTLVNPKVFCPNIPGSFPETYLDIGGVLVAQYYDGQGRSQLAILVPGNYVTTDGRNCHFSVDSGGHVID